MNLAPIALAITALAFGSEAQLMEGNSKSDVRILIYEDLQCPDCAHFREMLDRQILPRFGQKAAFEHRDFPLPKHKWARKAAIASRFFGTVSPKLAIEWRRYALSNLSRITPENFNETVSAFAREHGADPARAIAALDDKAFADAVERDYQDGVARGIAHTPTVLVVDEPFIETFTFEEISASLEKATSGR
jgi:protein-disulfide isomerase